VREGCGLQGGVDAGEEHRAIGVRA